MYTLADTQKALTALALRHGDDAAILAQVVANITCATTHKCKDQIAAKLHSGCGPRIGQSRGEASVTPPGLPPLLELNARSPVAVDLDRTSLSLGG
jgi:hypothetical protein